MMIGNVLSSNTGGVHQYRFNDSKPTAGISWYRLKLIDKDGRFTYSKVVTISTKNANGLATYPNPVTSTLFVTHPKALSNAVIKILTADGRYVATYPSAMGTGITAVNLGHLPVGNYLVVMQNGAAKMVTRFIKQQ